MNILSHLRRGDPNCHWVRAHDRRTVRGEWVKVTRYFRCPAARLDEDEHRGLSHPGHHRAVSTLSVPHGKPVRVVLDSPANDPTVVSAGRSV